MNTRFVLFLVLILSVNISAQTNLQRMVDTETAFIKALSSKGIKAASLEYLSDDATIFRPQPVNGKDYWKSQTDNSPALMLRKPNFADIGANGQIGYTMGTWELYPDGKLGSPLATYGQYLTVWEKRQGDKFKVTIDIGIENDQLTYSGASRLQTPAPSMEINMRGWSVTEDSMDFFTLSQKNKSLGKAYKKFADDDVRILREQMPPIAGKENVVKQTKQYNSIGFPAKVSMLQSADIAYIWNQCEFADSNEGRENGNCLHIWKLKNQKWYIVAGVFARVPNVIPPKLTTKLKPNLNKGKKKKSEKD